MKALAPTLVIIYVAFSLPVLVHTLLQFSLALSYLRRYRSPDSDGGKFVSPATLPRVTIQLPVYNEKYVVERLIDASTCLRYPRDRLQIQVLDDSTDETVKLVAARVRHYRAQGFDIQHLRRPSRDGFKAGALRNGLTVATGELIAIFDADFVPHPNFLEATVPHFSDKHVGMVQTCWGHSNREQSLLTRLQAVMLDAHFTIEQVGRSCQGCFVNFNGSAGIWRASAIHDAGNWGDSTLVEDVDLSYRAQLRGWRFIYLEDILSRADLPADIRSFRSQQFRWMKGGAENAVRLVPRILGSSLVRRVKVHACAHLLESTLYLCILAMILITAPLAVMISRGFVSRWWLLNPLFMVSGLALVYLTPEVKRRANIAGYLQYLGMWSRFFAVTMGLSFHNSVAVLQGLCGQRTEFMRTPKGWQPSARLNSHDNVYLLRDRDPIAPLEIAVWIYLAAGLLWGFIHRVIYLFWMPAGAFLGLTFILLSSLRYSLARPDHARAAGQIRAAGADKRPA